MNRRLTTFTSLVGLLATSATWAQPEPLPEEDSGQRWYRVELMIFSQGGAGAASAERWDPLPALDYPERHRFLVYPDKVEQRIAAHPAGENQEVTSTLEADGKQVIEFINLALEEAPGPETPPDEGPLDIPYRDAGRAAQASGEEPPLNDPEALPGQAGVLAGEALPEEDAPPPRPTPWRVRPAAELEFRGKAAYMENRGGYEMLFHQSWLQPIAGEKQARAIVIDDSGTEARYPRLQGSVRIYVARFLHLETDLWLNTDGAYLPGDWRMPAPPLAPASLSIVEPVSLETLGETVTRGDAVLEGETGVDGATRGPAASDIAPARAQATPTGPLPDPAAAEDSALEVEPPPPYPYRHAVLLQQHRRMRSAEVHYLDHPMLGVVVKLTPLSEETLEQLGAAEQEAAAAQEAAAPAGKPPGDPG